MQTCPEHLRFDDWVQGAEHGSQPSSASVPLFWEVHEEIQNLWKAPFTARSHSAASSTFTTLDGRTDKG